MAGVRVFTDLKFWQRARAWSKDIFQDTKRDPFRGDVRLVVQINDSSESVGANIAEGCGRRGNSEFHRFLQIASGSCSELTYHLLLARDLGYLDASEYSSLETSAKEVHKMLAGLIAKIDSDRLATDH